MPLTITPGGIPGVEHARREIESSYGISTTFKPKTLRKFGRVTGAAADTKTTLQTLLGSEANETFVTTNAIDGVVSSSASDTGVLTIEGHYYDSDDDLVFSTQDVTLNGQTKVTLTQPLARATRAFVKVGTFASPAVDLVGDVCVYASDGVTVTAGVPQTDSAVKVIIVGTGGYNQSQKASTSLSSQDWGAITEVYAAASRGNSATTNVDIEVEWREQGGVWLPLGLEMSLRTGAKPSDLIMLHQPAVVPPNSDLRMVATSDSSNTKVSGWFNIALLLQD